MGGIRGVVVRGRIGILLFERGVGNIWEMGNGRMGNGQGRYIWCITWGIAYAY
jgi:hypothetical protein